MFCGERVNVSALERRVAILRGGQEKLGEMRGGMRNE